MPLLKHRKPMVSDPWILLEDNSSLEQIEEFSLIPVKRFLENSVSPKVSHWGLIIDGDTDLEQIRAHLENLSLLAVDFPALRDGRGFSIARTIRSWGYVKEIRALGDITRDRLAFLERCGFDSVWLEDSLFDTETLAAYDEISVRYQGCELEPKPIYSQS